jgi:hypothetical protein
MKFGAGTVPRPGAGTMQKPQESRAPGSADIARTSLSSFGPAAEPRSRRKVSVKSAGLTQKVWLKTTYFSIIVHDAQGQAHFRSLTPSV